MLTTVLLAASMVVGQVEQPKEVKELEPGRIVVEGSAELRVVEEYFGRDLPGKPTDTVSRWLLRHLGRIPEGEERFVFDGLDVLVQLVTGSRVEQVVLQNRHEPGIFEHPEDEDVEGATHS